MSTTIHINGNLIYTATSSGLNIYDTYTDELYAYINQSEGFSAVFGNDVVLYLGTPQNGLRTLYFDCVSGSTSLPIDLTSCLNNLNIPLTSNIIQYIHGDEQSIGVCTSSGVDYHRFGPNGFHSSTVISGTNRCFVTSQYIYYTKPDSLNKADVRWDWVTPGTSYIIGGTIFETEVSFNDLYVIENTNYNTIYCATSSGVYVIDEETTLSGNYTRYLSYT